MTAEVSRILIRSSRKRRQRECISSTVRPSHYSPSTVIFLVVLCLEVLGDCRYQVTEKNLTFDFQEGGLGLGGDRKGGAQKDEEDLSALTRQQLLGASPAEEQSETEPPPRQPLLVIGAGYPRTGTASFTIAMQRLGLKSYHMTKGVHATPGHAALWARHGQSRIDGSPTGRAAEIIEAMAQTGFNATNDFPATFLFHEFREAYPNAPVVLTVRSEDPSEQGRAFADSIRNTIFLFGRPLTQFPFRWMRHGQNMLTMRKWMFQVELGLPTSVSDNVELDANGKLLMRGSSPADIERGTKMLSDHYDNWIRHVKESVPPEQLLVFAAKEGWKPLCDFLSPVDPSVAAACRDVLERGEAYPRINDRISMQQRYHAMKRLNFLATRVYLPAAAVLVVAIVFAASWCWKKRKWQQQNQENGRMNSHQPHNCRCCKLKVD